MLCTDGSVEGLYLAKSTGDVYRATGACSRDDSNSMTVFLVCILVFAFYLTF